MDNPNPVGVNTVPAIPPMAAVPNAAAVIDIPTAATEAPPPQPLLLPPLAVGLPTAAVTTTAATTAAATTTTPLHDPAKPPLPSISFDAIYSELHAYQTTNGSLTIPASHPALARITDILTGAGIEKIASRRWDDQLDNLRSYRARHGNCDVPPSHPTLGRWAGEQRAYYKERELGRTSPLTDDRYERLKGLSLAVNLWDKRLEELRAYKDEHGHTDVPLEYPRLGVWVLNQRDAYHFEREDFPQVRVDALDAIGFDWNRWGRNRLKTREDQWEAQFNKLLEYIKENGTKFRTYY